MNFFLFLSLIIGLFSLSAFSQDFDKAKLDKFFDALETNNKFMGSVAVSKNGDIIYTRSAGFSDVENGIKANDNSKYRIGSISKTFTATAEKTMVLKQGGGQFAFVKE